MSEAPPRILFVGGFGHHYLKGLRDSDGTWRRAQAAMLIDTYAPEIAEKHAQALGCTQTFRNWDDAIAQFKPTIASIGVAYGFNGCEVLAALKHNLPVVSDKPIAATWQQLSDIETFIETHGGQVLTEFDFRARDCFRAARLAVQSGRIGEPTLITAQKSYRFGTRPPWYGSREWFAGLVLWVASHGIDAGLFTTGVCPTHVTGQGGNLSRSDYAEMEDHVALLYRLANGGTFVVHADFLRPAAAKTHGDDRLRIVGSQGQIDVQDDRCVLATHDAGPLDITDEGAGPAMAEALVDALNCPDPAAAFSTQQSLTTARLLLHSRDAADARQWIEL